MNKPEQRRRFQFTLRTLFIFVTVVSVVLAVGISWYRHVQQASHKTRCEYNVKQLGLSIMSRYSTNRGLPPACVPDANGKPMHSWRVTCLPYMECAHLYDAYDFGQAWNGPSNRKLTQMPPEFCCPAARNSGSSCTNYVAVIGDQTVWPGPRGIRFSEITDGASNTIAVLELAESDIHWMEPRDLTFDEAVAAFEGQPGAPKLREHPGGMVVGFADGSVKVLSQQFLRQHGKALLTRAGGEEIPWPE